MLADRPNGLRDFGAEMPTENAAKFLPSDPRYGLSEESPKDYYRTKPASGRSIAGTSRRRRTPGAPCCRIRRTTSGIWAGCVISYGHFVSDDGRDTLATSFFMQRDDRAAADTFPTDESLNKAGVYQRVDIHRWSNSFTSARPTITARACSSSCARAPRPALRSSSALDTMGNLNEHSPR
jgi:hypothetical protein